METKRKLEVKSDSLKGLRGFVEVYEEVAASRMQAIRKEVITAREFLEGLGRTFVDVKSNYDKEVGAIIAKSRLNRNGKTVAVFISANSGLYGDIINRTWQIFVEYISKNKADAVIVGKLGLRLQQESRPNLLFNYFDFSDVGIDPENLGLAMRYLLQFEKILVFYGKFVSLVIQTPTVTSVSGDDVEKLTAVNSEAIVERRLFLFEPTLEDILGVFESEILASIFEQTVFESQLAKFASRLMNLDGAMQNIDEELERLHLERRKLAHKIEGKKQLGRIAGMRVWA